MTDGEQKTEYTPYRLTARQRRYMTVKRGLDTVLSLVLMVLFALPMAAIALALKFSAPGEPVLFRQERVGLDGALFILWKFRSMDLSGRVTRLGRFLRTASLDELPQLIQVLTGDMALVGPRPLIPQETAVHEPRFAAGVYQLRPGITGLAQINGRDRVTDREKAAYDRAYLEQLSLRQDWHILCATVGKVLRRADVEDTPPQ